MLVEGCRWELKKKRGVSPAMRAVVYHHEWRLFSLWEIAVSSMCRGDYDRPAYWNKHINDDWERSQAAKLAHLRDLRAKGLL